MPTGSATAGAVLFVVAASALLALLAGWAALTGGPVTIALAAAAVVGLALAAVRLSGDIRQGRM